jgi:hypothetical protein
MSKKYYYPITEVQGGLSTVGKRAQLTFFYN